MAVMYACVADVGTGARCREFIPWPQTRCESHKDSVQVARMPDVIRICFSLQHPQWSMELQREGIQRGQPKNREEQATKIVAHAQQFGHDANAYRKDFPDSGTLAFYTSESGIPEAESLKRGLKSVSLWEAFKELLGTFSLGLVFIEPRERKTDRLIVPLYREWVGPLPFQEVSPEAMTRLLKEFASSWDVHVYANPPRPDGKIVHTINAHGRKEEPAVVIRFNHGLWAVA